MTDGPTRQRRDSGRTRDRTRPPVPEPLPGPVTDTHCHLDISDDVSEDEWWPAARALQESTAVNVTRIVQVGCDLPGARWAVACAQQHEQVVAAVALHPNEAPVLAAAGQLSDALSEIEELARDPAVRVVGETGLDYFRTGPDGHAVQQESFRAHIDMAKRLDRTLQIHDRDAHDDVLRILDEEGAPPRTVFHCFSGDAAMARHCAERGWFLSFAGTVTFKNAAGLREAAAAVPLDRLLVETDAPYLTPAPHRGRPNASYLVPLTVRALADVVGVELDVLCRQLEANTAAAIGTW